MYTLNWHPYASSVVPLTELEENGISFELYQLKNDAGPQQKLGVQKWQAFLCGVRLTH